ncbi:LamG domain-containing protein [Commensalibacter papalotli (ex Servin-Garciduenas et al. 2014)]|uniref:Uncharacterized protein n=1 Tax=Commensalibacter papalotli (ex Servin-Garciduenas et al. 2014) TaxID=1208583 RepID=W7DWH0_9PROT|nr:hypothetical protein [Commensalibacter papalotli (ex Servin-Garciduenas et al. 2014)]EUK18568.1 hypothetical protein COMX_02430 [Commensalibacter papalotli (ex Servin-Garciduenas et al. 2014)]
MIENVGNLSDVVSNFIALRGDRGETGKDDISYINEGNADINVNRITSDEGNIKSDGFCNLSLSGVKLKDINNLTSFDHLLQETICFDSNKKQFLVKEGREMIPLNVTNLNLEQQYKLNNGVQPLNFAPDHLNISTGGNSDGNGVKVGYLYVDTKAILPVPPTMQIRVTFTLWIKDKDFDYHIAGWLNKWNVRANPAKNTVSVYNGNDKQYEVLCSSLTSKDGLKLNDGNNHILHINVNGGYEGFNSFSIDGEYFNRGYSVYNGAMTELRFRGDENIVVPTDECSVKDIFLSSTQRTKVDKQPVDISNYDYEAYYPCLNNNYTNGKIADGFLLKATSNFDSFQWLNPYYFTVEPYKNKSIFTSEGMTGGVASFNVSMSVPTFTFECQFKFSSTINDTSIRRVICGRYQGNYSIGLTAKSDNKLTIKYHNANPDVEVTLVDTLTLDIWHTLAISSNNNLMQVFIDGKLLHTKYFVTNFEYFYIRSLDYNAYIVEENSLIIKNISLLIGKAKYADKDYDPSLTPISATNFNTNGFFYPLKDSRIKNENETSPLVKITNITGSFSLRTVKAGKTSKAYISQPTVSYTQDNTPVIINTKGASVLVTSYSNDVLKETI